MNRFSRGPIAADVQSNFIPLPVDAISRQIDRKQGQYDTTKAHLGAMEDTVLGVRGLGKDAETLKGIQSQYNDEILKGIEEVGGDYSRLGGLTDITARKLKKDLSTGHLAAIQSNYLAAQEHQDTLKKMRESGRIGDRGFEQGMRSISDFEGTKETSNGGYTSANLYTPVKEISLPEAGQKYAKASADQYLATGQKYLSVGTVAKNTYNNLIGDESVVSNAREEIKYKYGKLSQDKEDKLTNEYLWNIARNSGTERAFLEQFKPEKSTLDENGLPVVVGYDKTGVNPTKSGLGKRMDTIIEKGVAAVASPALSAGDIFSPTGGDAIVKGMEAIKRVQEEKKKLVGTRKLVDNDPIVKDKLEMEGIDVSKLNDAELKVAVKNINDIDEASRNTQYTIERSAKANSEFDARNNSEFIKDGPIVDADNKPLSAEKRKDIISKMNASVENGGYKLINGGAVSAYGQPWPKGTIKVGAGEETIMILPNQPNSPAHTLDRLLYVITPGSGGYTEYQNGRYKEVLQTVKNPNDPTKVAIRKYRVDSEGTATPTNEYYIPNTGEDRGENPFKMLVPKK